MTELEQRLLKALKNLLSDVEGLMGESSGVYGLHLNGDVSPWSEIDEGGRFERLSNLSEARAVIEEAEYARAEPVNARLVEALRGFVDHGTCFDDEDMERARAAIAAAEAQQSEPARLTDERIFDICKSMLVEGYHGDYLENDGFELAKEIEAETLRANGFKVED